ncbi:MAG: hypothetical protein LBC64_08270 [Fibromonadaceae bacterium]|jgi:hypothetical protein|nr:hypothetical protein [Fibromonadaceae bacterium]
MRTQLIKITLTASILLAYAFTASCSTDDKDGDDSSSSGTVFSPSPSSSSRPSSSSNPGSGSGSSSSGGSSQGYVAFNVNSQIYLLRDEYDEELDDFVFRASSYSDNGFVEESLLERIGTVRNGKVTGLQLLTKNIPDDELYSALPDQEDFDSCPTYTHDGLGYWASFRLITADDDYEGDLTIESKNGDYENLRYFYSSKAGKIVCNMNSEYSSVQYNLDLKKGWNEIYIKAIDSEDSYEMKYSTSSNIMTSEIVWRLSYSYYPW